MWQAAGGRKQASRWLKTPFAYGKQRMGEGGMLLVCRVDGMSDTRIDRRAKRIDRTRQGKEKQG